MLSFLFHSVGGIIVGFLKAFDKHFNLLLTDVDEEYSLTGRNIKVIETKGKEKGKGSSNFPDILRR